MAYARSVTHAAARRRCGLGAATLEASADTLEFPEFPAGWLQNWTQEVLQSHVLTHAACLGCDALPDAFRAGECTLRGSRTIVPIFSVINIAFQRLLRGIARLRTEWFNSMKLHEHARVGETASDDGVSRAVACAQVARKLVLCIDCADVPRGGAHCTNSLPWSQGCNEGSSRFSLGGSEPASFVAVSASKSCSRCTIARFPALMSPDSTSPDSAIDKSPYRVR